ncbi:D-glycero-alpha-D-manno-heptose-1,7-bisphosphate 7-phosphatase [Chloroflexota bacterium]
MEKAVFLDRDGTLIEDAGYLGERDKIKFLPRVSRAVKLLNENGFKVIVITNQAGVARGYFTEETVRGINEYIQESLIKHVAFIDKFYYCPHHIDGIIEEYSKECYYRKPNPGMIEKAVGEFDIDLKNSFVIGDKTSDIEAGRRAGCQTILLTGEDPPNNGTEIALISDYVTPDLYEAVIWLLELSRQKERQS